MFQNLGWLSDDDVNADNCPRFWSCTCDDGECEWKEEQAQQEELAQQVETVRCQMSCCKEGVKEIMQERTNKPLEPQRMLLAQMMDAGFAVTIIENPGAPVPLVKYFAYRKNNDATTDLNFIGKSGREYSVTSYHIDGRGYGEVVALALKSRISTPVMVFGGGKVDF